MVARARTIGDWREQQVLGRALYNILLLLHKLANFSSIISHILSLKKMVPGKLVSPAVLNVPREI